MRTKKMKPLRQENVRETKVVHPKDRFFIAFGVALVAAALIPSCLAYADPVATPSPLASAAAVVASSPAAGTSLDAFFAQVVTTFQSLGGIPWSLKVSAILMLIVAALKVSLFSRAWAKLGAAQVLVAPGLSLIAGGITVAVARFNGTPFSWTLFLTTEGAWMFSGVGSVAMHQFMDGIKAIPGLNSTFIAMVNFCELYLLSPLKTTTTTTTADSTTTAPGSSSS